ncbi:hypothetical protein LG943_05850 [Streptomonospora sp. S1-112]|uniref:Uncharacterized protein n=1 Tax=Streptomonospora mangrovi TaxID=2883123 RepID=A0A9X3NI41_9ACTN|nr:hypothetical protein [Streptomonospora mangrovi]MDA0563852.1 hypothetical protein [Streptomonospora mangrovi]
MTPEAPEPPWAADPGGGIGTVSGGARTVAADLRGPVHSGDGDQYINNYYTLTDALKEIQALTPHRPRARAAGRVTTEEIERVLACFVPPPGFTASARTGGTAVVLSGGQGSGRRAAAIRLLQEGRRETGPIRVLPDSDEEPPHLDEDSVEEGEPLLLDLSSADSERFARVAAELASYRDRVARCRGRLVVVVATEQEAALREAFPAPVLRIGRPDPVEVLRRHLAYHRVEVAPDVLAAADMRARLERSAADEAAHIADLVARHREQNPSAGGADLAELLRQAAGEDGHWAAKVGDSIERNAGLRQRAVLLTAAMLHGYSTDAAFEAAEQLIAAAAPPEEPDQPPRLARQGFIKQLQDLGVEVRRDRSFAFTGLNYDAAVRNRFWDEFPDQHATFRRWVEECSRSRRSPATALDSSALAALGQRFAEQVLRTREPKQLLLVAEDWRAEARRAGHCHSDLMLGVLEMMLGDEKAAFPARVRLREWSRDADLAVPLAEVLIVVCERTLALTHPEQAVVRLRHLTRHRRPRVAEQAAATLVGLANGDAAMHRTLVHVLANRMVDARRNGARLYAADRDLLWRATEPDLLHRLGPPIAASPSRHERAALAEAMADDPAEARRHTERWLAASTHGRRAAPPPPGGDRPLPDRLESVAVAAVAAGRWMEAYSTALRFAEKAAEDAAEAKVTSESGPPQERRRETAETFTARLRVLRGLAPRSRDRADARKDPR